MLHSRFFYLKIYKLFQIYQYKHDCIKNYCSKRNHDIDMILKYYKNVKRSLYEFIKKIVEIGA